jgi:hypothetical protein
MSYCYAVILLLVGFTACAQSPQVIHQDGDLYTLTRVSTDAAQGHLSGNDFEAEIGKTLKAQYPSRILEPRVELRTFHKGAQIYFGYRWVCRIVATTPDKADFYFTRRGTVMSGKTVEEAKAAVEREIQSSQKVQKVIDSFNKQYGNHNMPLSFVRSSWAGSSEEGFWYIQEFFITARK